MASGYLFRASWPILDDTRTLGMLRAEACQHIDQLAADAGARIVGDITWTTARGRLFAQAPARPTATEVRAA